jgi:hypothetical protein
MLAGQNARQRPKFLKSPGTRFLPWPRTPDCSDAEQLPNIRQFVDPYREPPPSLDLVAEQVAHRFFGSSIAPLMQLRNDVG